MYKIGDRVKRPGRGYCDRFQVVEKEYTLLETLYTLQNTVLKYKIESISEDALKTLFIKLT